MKHIQLSAVSFVISPAEQTWSISTIHYAAVLLYWRQTHFHYWIHHLLHKVFRDTNTCFHQCQRCKHCSTLSFVSVHENRNENESRLLKWFKHKPERRRRTEKLKQTNVESQREGEGEGEGERREERGERRRVHVSSLTSSGGSLLIDCETDGRIRSRPQTHVWVLAGLLVLLSRRPRRPLRLYFCSVTLSSRYKSFGHSWWNEHDLALRTIVEERQQVSESKPASLLPAPTHIAK